MRRVLGWIRFTRSFCPGVGPFYAITSTAPHRPALARFRRSVPSAPDRDADAAGQGVEPLGDGQADGDRFANHPHFAGDVLTRHTASMTDPLKGSTPCHPP